MGRGIRNITRPKMRTKARMNTRMTTRPKGIGEHAI
jgi:hypothetical protein